MVFYACSGAGSMRSFLIAKSWTLVSTAKLAQMIVDLHQHLGVQIPGGPSPGEHLLLDTLQDGRLRSMEVLEAERAIYIAVITGKEMEIGRIPTGPPPEGDASRPRATAKRERWSRWERTNLQGT